MRKKTSVADGRKSSKLVACKSPNQIYENPGDLHATSLEDFLPSATRAPVYSRFRCTGRRFSHVHVDFVGPFPPSRDATGIRMCSAPQWTAPPSGLMQSLYAALQPRTAPMPFFSSWVSRFDVPAHLTSDRRVHFPSAMWQTICQTLGIAHHAPNLCLYHGYHPPANGLFERFYRPLKDALRARLCGVDWVEHLPWVLLGILRAATKETRWCAQGRWSSVAMAGPSWPVPGHAGVASAGPRASMAGIADRLGWPLRWEQLVSYCSPQCFKARMVYIKMGASKPSLQLQPLYEGPCNRVLRAGQKVFVVQHRRPVTDGHSRPSEAPPGG
jgi:hypothetical protein